jgi:hypothetical protein
LQKDVACAGSCKVAKFKKEIAVWRATEMHCVVVSVYCQIQKGSSRSIEDIMQEIGMELSR